MLLFFTSLIVCSFASFAYPPSTAEILIKEPSSGSTELEKNTPPSELPPSIQERHTPHLKKIPSPPQAEQSVSPQPTSNNNPNIYSNPFAVDKNPSPSKEWSVNNNLPATDPEEWSLPVENNQNVVIYEKTQLELENNKHRKYRLSLQGSAIPFNKESQSKKLVLLNLYTDFAWIWETLEAGPFVSVDLALRLGAFNDLEELDIISGGFIEYHFFKTARRFDTSVGLQIGYSNRLLSQNRLYVHPYLSLKVFLSSRSALNFSAGPFGFFSTDSNIDYGIIFPRFGFIHYF